MSKLLDTRDAVITALNEHTWSKEFTAESVYIPQIKKLGDLKNIKVLVGLGAAESTIEARGKNKNDNKIQIGVFKRFDDDTEMDELIALVEEIRDYFLRRVLSGGVCVEIINDPIYIPEHYSSMRQFTSVLTLTVRYIS